MTMVVLGWAKEEKKIKVGVANQFCFDAKINSSKVLKIEL